VIESTAGITGSSDTATDTTPGNAG
jgi:hypothetical protein